MIHWGNGSNEGSGLKGQGNSGYLSPDDASGEDNPMRKINKLTFAAGVMTLMSCLPSMAQGFSVTFTTTFGFYAGRAKLPAGTYTLRAQPDDPNIFELQNGAGHPLGIA